MSPTLRRLGSPALASLLVAAVVWGEGGTDAGPEASSVFAGSYLPLKALHEDMIARLAALQSNGQTVAAADLLAQLERPRCRVDLARPFRRRHDLPDLYDANCPSIGIVCSIYQCKRCAKWHASTASGFFVSGDGRFLTNHHVMHQTNHTAFGVLTFDRRMHAVREVLAADRTNDLALIRIDGQGYRPLPIVAGASVGDPIALISHPKNNYYTLSNGIISSYVLDGPRDQALRRMTISADYGVGSSGAPVLDLRGNVVGLVRDTYTINASPHKGDAPGAAQMVVRHCIPAEVILELLQ